MLFVDVTSVKVTDVSVCICTLCTEQKNKDVVFSNKQKAADSSGFGKVSALLHTPLFSFIT